MMPVEVKHFVFWRRWEALEAGVSCLIKVFYFLKALSAEGCWGQAWREMGTGSKILTKGNQAQSGLVNG